MKRRLIDGRGEPGRVGSSGTGYLAGVSPGGSGRLGGMGQAGGPGTGGRPGGQIEAHLLWDESNGLIARGKCRGETFSLVCDPKETEEIFLTARGGDGGRGGGGGRGQDGSKGYRGSNATRYSSGGNGGPGGHGGRGGDAGNGGPSGAGGEIVLEVSPQDSDLLLALDWDVSAGEPGPPGEPGPGGSGGSGGAGGSSYSWTESQTYTDSEGRTQTRTTYHSNPGGSSGPSGRTGAKGSVAQAGSRGPDGTFTLKLGAKDYPDRYRLQCEDFHLLSGDGDDIFEFGEQNNRVIGLVAKNIGAAPSPPAHVFARMVGESPILPKPESYPIHSLQEDQETVLPDFHFDLAEAQEEQLPTVHEVLSVPVTITPKAGFTRLHRDAPEFEKYYQFQLTFPVELVTKPSSTSLTQEGLSKQDWIIVNRSNQEFPPPHRELLLDLSLLDEGAQLRVSDGEGRVRELTSHDELFSTVGPIPAGGSVVVTAFLAAEEQSQPYGKATLTASLRLTPQGGGEARVIQRNPTEYSVALAHQDRPADVLLVTHHGSSAEEVKNWLALLEQLKLSWNVWDISLNGGFPLKKLAEYYTGKLVVVLNTPFSTPNRKTAMPTDFLDLQEFRICLAEHGLSFYFLGEETDILNHLVPQPRDSQTFTSPTEYLKKGDFLRTRVNPEIPACMNARIDKIQISRFFLTGKPRPEYLVDVAKTLLQKLKKKMPQSRFLVTTIFRPDKNEGWLRSRDCGILEVRKLLDHDARAVVTRTVYRENGQSPAFLFSSENLLGFFSAKDFDDKLEMLGRLEGLPESTLEALADAVLMDLSEEQMDLRRSNVTLGKRKLLEALNRTAMFCSQDYRQGRKVVALDSELGTVLVRVAAGVEFLANHQMAWWDHRVRFLGGSNDVEVTLCVRGLVDKMLDKNFGPDRIWGTAPPRKRVDEMVKNRLETLEAERSAVAEVAGAALSKKATSLESLVRWELRDYLNSDSEADSAIWSQDKMEELQAKECSLAKRREQLLKLFQSALEAARVDSSV